MTPEQEYARATPHPVSNDGNADAWRAGIDIRVQLAFAGIGLILAGLALVFG